MKYRVLLAGKNNTIIDEFFTNMYNSFECQTTSKRYEDIASHLHYFNPDILIYCIQNDTPDDFLKMISIKRCNYHKNIPFVIIGDPEECAEFTKTAVNVADLVLEKPITSTIIETRIQKYLKQKNQFNESIADEIQKANAAFEEIVAPKPPKKHVLVIDDDSRMLKVINLHLHEKYDVATAISGKVALKFLESKTTDLILLDYAMPNENGLAVLDKLRSNPATKDIPVIFLTGITDRKKIKDALVMKPQGYLLKPIDRKRLLATIQSIIG